MEQSRQGDQNVGTRNPGHACSVQDAWQVVLTFHVDYLRIIVSYYQYTCMSHQCTSALLQVTCEALDQ